ncbi:hypothetical protein [Haloferula sp. BvORR071]|uniref:hypothetical protein n=1 Tax=Haloferula sp. BvORR071 TaxID=1396141 RepID=UPI000553C6CA|nr:hypothetical protein [Haloferula sp. BvORR071]
MRTLISCLLLSLLSIAHARFAPSYTFEELMQRSDLVVIIEHESTRQTDERDEERYGSGRLTTAKILTTLKGESKETKISIRHIYYPRNPNSPNSVEFPDTKEQVPLSRGTKTTYANPPWRYLAFLKKGPDGTYVPSVDAYDSALCFLSLVDSGIVAWLAEPPPKAEDKGK